MNEDEDWEETPYEAIGGGNDTDAELATEATVSCPYCGESVDITLDPAGGTEQRYVEDCEVCCRPWQVNVVYDEEGAATVWVDETG